MRVRNSFGALYTNLVSNGHVPGQTPERGRIGLGLPQCRFELPGGANGIALRPRYGTGTRGLPIAVCGASYRPPLRTTLPSLDNYYDFFVPASIKAGVARVAATLVIADRAEQGQN